MRKLYVTVQNKRRWRHCGMEGCSGDNKEANWNEQCRTTHIGLLIKWGRWENGLTHETKRRTI